MSEASKVGEAALAVLRGRRGFYGWWDGIDPEIQEEIRDAIGEAALAAPWEIER